MVSNSQLHIQTTSKTFAGIARIVSLLIGKLFFRLKYHDRQNIPTEVDKGLIIVSNHQTYLDPFLICAPINRTMRFMAWDEAFRWRISARLLRMLGAFPVSLKRGGTIRAMVTSIELLKRGETLMIFPEGAREFSDGKFLPFKTGAARLALETGVPILPVTIKGGNLVWSQDHKYPKPGKIEIFYHPVLRPERDACEDAHAVKLTEKLRGIIASV